MSKHNAAEVVHIRSSIKLAIAFQVDMFTVLPRDSNSQVDGRLQIYSDNTHIHMHK